MKIRSEPKPHIIFIVISTNIDIEPGVLLSAPHHATIHKTMYHRIGRCFQLHLYSLRIITDIHHFQFQHFQVFRYSLSMKAVEERKHKQST